MESSSSSVKARNACTFCHYHFVGVKTCGQCPSNEQKSRVSTQSRQLQVGCSAVNSFVAAQCTVCWRKISQLIEYLKLPNRNFKFITQCSNHPFAQSAAGNQPAERPFNGHYLLHVCVCVCSLSPSLFSLPLTHSPALVLV